MSRPPLHGSDEAEWAERIRNGSYPAFEAFFTTYYEELVRFGTTIVRRQDVAEDLVQDVFFNIWRTRAHWHPKGALRPYLYGATRNHCLMYLNRKRLERGWEADEEAAEKPGGAIPEQDFRYEELDRAYRLALEALPERRRLIFTMSRQQGLTYGEIAGLLGISVNTVEVQMVRAMKFLRDRLSDFLVPVL